MASFYEYALMSARHSVRASAFSSRTRRYQRAVRATVDGALAVRGTLTFAVGDE